MEKCAWILTTCLCLLAAPTIAGAAFPTDCSDACLGDYQNAGCSSLCSDRTSDVHCDLTEAMSDPAAVVYAFADGGTYLVFGTKGGTEFCCDESDFTANFLTIDTDDEEDLVCAGYPGATCNPATTTCTWNSSSDWDYPTLIRTRGEYDEAYGSDYDTSCGPDDAYFCDDIDLGTGIDNGSGYGGRAEGGDGGDRIGATGSVGIRAWGDAGRDKIRGSDGSNQLWGGYNSDVIYGGDESDYIVLGPGDAYPVPKQWANGLDEADEIYGDTTDDVLCGDWNTDSAVDELYGSTGDDRCTHPTEDSFSSCETDDYECNGAPF